MTKSNWWCLGFFDGLIVSVTTSALRDAWRGEWHDASFSVEVGVPLLVMAALLAAASTVHAALTDRA